jgi:hypothetical protein
MEFFRGVPAPSIECVVESHSCFELGEIVGIHPRQPEGRRNGATSNRSATPAAVTNTARGSTKRRISHGKAMRSTLDRERATRQCVPGSLRHLSGAQKGQAGFDPTGEPILKSFGLNLYRAGG